MLLKNNEGTNQERERHGVHDTEDTHKKEIQGISRLMVKGDPRMTAGYSVQRVTAQTRAYPTALEVTSPGN